VETAQKLRDRRPVLMVERAVWGMIPKTRLGRAQFGKLKVYAGEAHPHESQQPVAHEIR
jgi:large subunit ribosomal protein L13